MCNALIAQSPTKIPHTQANHILAAFCAMIQAIDTFLIAGFSACHNAVDSVIPVGRLCIGRLPSPSRHLIRRPL